MIRDVALSLVCGLVVGALFGGLRLPVPAPPTAAGVAGIIGITLGWWLVLRWR